MLHIYECKNCGAPIHAYCFEYLNYTESGRETRNRQLDAMLCIPCFGETPELAPVQTPVPCYDLRDGSISARTSE
jgi:hypothetical protein